LQRQALLEIYRSSDADYHLAERDDYVMRSFITGIAGFVGQHLAEHLRACGDEVLGTSLRGEGEHLAWDISHPPSAGLVQRLQEFAPQAIYHLAAVSKATDCDDDAALAEQINVGGTRHILNLAAQLPSAPRVLFVSSSYVYAEPRGGAPLDECAPLRSDLAANAYARTKIAGEQAVLDFAARGGNALIARAFQHTGPGQSPKFMLAEWCEQFASGASPVVIQRNNATIDLSDVRDVVRAYRLLMEHGQRGEIYNVGSGRAAVTGEIFEMLRRIVDPARPCKVRNEQPAEGPIADISKIRRATGWEPRISLEQTVRDTYASFTSKSDA
jgi:GDP-4-dehydro-6-deoxy-D-mannose reductase